MSNRSRLIITVSGCVQGVGFRPYIYRLAQQHEVVGSIKNTTSGVVIDAEGEISSLVRFQDDLPKKIPTGASISEMQTAEAPLVYCKEFVITSSECQGDTELALLPDTALCAECLQELSDPRNRRYRYPFIHCMSCGPRFSLFTRMPFDRANTSMADFPLCSDCLREYNNPADRRYYSQTNCCPACGPKLELFTAKRELLGEGENAIEQAALLIRQGRIVALKNTGGFLLLANAYDQGVVCRLRNLKRRPKKPFAVLMSSLMDVRKVAETHDREEEVLASSAAPIVLLKKKKGLAPSVSCESPYHGIMLCHNALQVLLLEKTKCPLVATSGNLSGNPICTTEEEAFLQLGNLADLFLIHIRKIMHRMDDSIVQVVGGRPMVVRRARGYIPYAVNSPNSPAETIFSAGSHMKNSFALAKNNKIYLSQHMGDLDSHQVCEAYEQEVASWEKLLNVTPTKGVGDCHPGYYSTISLKERNIPAAFIQHHRAHAYAGMADNKLQPPFLSIVWDGTGLGDDLTIWGGEAFLVTAEEAPRFATLAPFPLPGSEKAVLEPRRALLGVMYTIFGQDCPPVEGFTADELKILLSALDKNINAPLCSSMGRLFDAVSALLGCCLYSSFEGEAALALQALALQAKGTSRRLSFTLSLRDNIRTVEWQAMIRNMLTYKEEGVEFSELALDFHIALTDLIVQLAHQAGLQNVLLTGGCMQNKLLVEMAINRLREEGFTPCWHQDIPPNDGGIAVGQIVGMWGHFRPSSHSNSRLLSKL